MKNTKIKLFVMFLAGVLFSAITVFAATINVSTNFSSNAVQYLQKLVLTDINQQTRIILDGNGTNKVQITGNVLLNGNISGKNFVGNTIQGQTGKFSSYCSNDGTTCATIDDMIGGGGESLWLKSGLKIYYNQGNVGIGTNDAQEKLHVDGNGKFSQNVIASKFCNENGTICNTADEMIGGGDKNIPLNSITTNKIVDNSITQGKVENGYVDLSSSQSIEGQKTFNNNLIINNKLSLPNEYAKVNIGTGDLNNGYTMNIYGSTRIDNDEYSTTVGNLNTSNPFYKTYLGKFKDENGSGNGTTANYGMIIQDVVGYGIGLRVAMKNPTGKAATFMGRVGVGLTEPLEALHVSGTGKFNDNLIIGGKLSLPNEYAKVNIGTGDLNNGYTMNVNGATKINNEEYSSELSNLQISNPFYRTYIGKWKDENGIGGGTTSNYGIIIKDMAGYGVGLRVAMKNPTGKAATFMGRVGVLTNTPEYSLHVNGKIYAGDNTNVTDEKILLQDENYTYAIKNDELGNFHIGQNNIGGGFTDDINRFTISENGNVGIGITEPKAKLSINGGIQIANITPNITPNDECTDNEKGTMIYVENANRGYVLVCIKFNASINRWHKMSLTYGGR